VLNNYKTLNFLLIYLPLIVFIPYGIYRFVAFGIYADFPYHIMHNITFVLIGISYYIGCKQYQHVSQPRRSLISLALIVTGLYASGLVWELCSHLASGLPEPYWYGFIFNFLVGVGLVYFLVAKRNIFKFNKKQLIPTLIALGVYAYMWFSGFFILDALYILGGPDPIYSPIWVIQKIVTVPMFSFSFQNKPENKTVDWKLV
jgi:hypothetical protein